MNNDEGGLMPMELDSPLIIEKAKVSTRRATPKVKAPKKVPKKATPKAKAPRKATPKAKAPRKATPKAKAPRKATPKVKAPEVKAKSAGALPPTFPTFLKEKGVRPLTEEAIRLINEGEDPGVFLSKNSMICALIDRGEIKFGSILGKGAYGEVFGLIFPSDPKRYAVKESKTKSLPKPCKTQTDIEVTRNDRRGVYIINKGALLCENTISEFYISLLGADLTRRGYTIHFLDVIYFGICKGTSVMQYTFMERVDTDLIKIIDHISLKDVESLYIQILHAICIYQRIYKIVHGDLHEKNVFIKYVDDPKTYLRYDVDDVSVYIPSSKYVAKIGDWGLAVKYKENVIANKDVLEDKYRRLLPNFYSGAYDVAYITYTFFEYRRDSPLFKNIMRWVLNGYDETDIFHTEEGAARGRPKIDMLGGILAHVSAEAILKNSILMKPFLTKPKGDIHLIGRI